MSFDFLAFERKLSDILLPIKLSIGPLYRDYVFGANPVSTPAMAASFETLILLTSLCQFRDPAAILDLGSGISSVALRKWRQVSKSRAQIVSVDTSADWLGKTKQFCQGSLGESTDFVEWGEPRITELRYDVVFFDIEMAGRRKLFFDDVFRTLPAAGASILVDDMHKPALQEDLAAYVGRVPHVRYDVMKHTYDCFGRYSTLLQLT